MEKSSEQDKSNILKYFKYVLRFVLYIIVKSSHGSRDDVKWQLSINFGLIWLALKVFTEKRLSSLYTRIKGNIFSNYNSIHWRKETKTE